MLATALIVNRRDRQRCQKSNDEHREQRLYIYSYTHEHRRERMNIFSCIERLNFAVYKKLKIVSLLRRIEI